MFFLWNLAIFSVKEKRWIPHSDVCPDSPSYLLMVGHHDGIQFQFNCNSKQIYCPTKYRIQHHGCDYISQITTGKISMNIHKYTYVYTVTYMLNCCPTLNQMLGDIHFRPLENENGNVLDQFHWSLWVRHLAMASVGSLRKAPESVININCFGSVDCAFALIKGYKHVSQVMILNIKIIVKKCRYYTNK